MEVEGKREEVKEEDGEGSSRFTLLGILFSKYKVIFRALHWKKVNIVIWGLDPYKFIFWAMSLRAPKTCVPCELEACLIKHFTFLLSFRCRIHLRCHVHFIYKNLSIENSVVAWCAPVEVHIYPFRDLSSSLI